MAKVNVYTVVGSWEQLALAMDFSLPNKGYEEAFERWKRSFDEIVIPISSRSTLDGEYFRKSIECNSGFDIMSTINSNKYHGGAYVIVEGDIKHFSIMIEGCFHLQEELVLDDMGDGMYQLMYKQAQELKRSASLNTNFERVLVNSGLKYRSRVEEVPPRKGLYN